MEGEGGKQDDVKGTLIGQREASYTAGRMDSDLHHLFVSSGETHVGQQ